MAEDVLRLAGLQEGVNYTKQSAADAESGTPDFTFMLPNDLKANMDVKFPLEAYKAYVDAESDAARESALKQLVSDVRNHVRAVAARGYIDPMAPTVPYVIVFIASEQIYALALAAEPDLMDEALGRKVVLASPLTLYAMLAVLRQALVLLLLVEMVMVVEEAEVVVDTTITISIIRVVEETSKVISRAAEETSKVEVGSSNTHLSTKVEVEASMEGEDIKDR